MSAKKELFASAISLRYSTLPRSGKVLWPIVEIMLPVLPQPILALVDSGSSFSILHEDVADIIGLKKKRSDKTGSGFSVSGTFKSWKSDFVPVEIYGYHFSFRFSVLIDNRSLVWPCILGHDSLFYVAKLEFKTFKASFKIAFRTDIN